MGFLLLMNIYRLLSLSSLFYIFYIKTIDLKTMFVPPHMEKGGEGVSSLFFFWYELNHMLVTHSVSTLNTKDHLSYEHYNFSWFGTKNRYWAISP